MDSSRKGQHSWIGRRNLCFIVLDFLRKGWRSWIARERDYNCRLIKACFRLLAGGMTFTELVEGSVLLSWTSHGNLPWIHLIVNCS